MCFVLVNLYCLRFIKATELTINNAKREKKKVALVITLIDIIFFLFAFQKTSRKDRREALLGLISVPP